MKLVRKLAVSIITAICVALCFTATTFAWFYVNSQADVDGFEFEAMGGQGFLISIDGVNYSNDLTASQMKKAIVKGYNPEKYYIEDNKLYDINTDEEVSQEAIDKILKENILLMPLTSNDGITLKDMYNSVASSNSGRYMEFDIYFKTASDRESDGFKYDIYLLGQDEEQIDGKVVTKTTISSEPTQINLAADMTTINGPYRGGDQINVYSSNALRFSIQEKDNVAATIYELTNEYDLGSYATDYSKQNDTQNEASRMEELDKLYNADRNAMFTYYNNLRPFSKIEKLSYENKPETVRNLDLGSQPKITHVASGSDSKLVTFRFWLEGWDADCFDGLANSINVKLSFTSVLITE